MLILNLKFLGMLSIALVFQCIAVHSHVLETDDAIVIKGK